METQKFGMWKMGSMERSPKSLKTLKIHFTKKFRKSLEQISFSAIRDKTNCKCANVRVGAKKSEINCIHKTPNYSEFSSINISQLSLAFLKDQ